MKMNFFSFLKKIKNNDSAAKVPSAGDAYQKRIYDANLSKFNERIDLYVKKFARNHRATVKEIDFTILHDAVKEIASDEISRFLYRREAEKIHLFFQQNGVCLRRNNAFFAITSITCFPSGQARVAYRTKDKKHRIVEHEETV